MASYNPSSVGFSFVSRVCPEIDPRLVVIQVSLKFKHRFFLRDQHGRVFDESIYHRIIGESNDSFPFYFYLVDASIRVSMAAYFKYLLLGWMPELTLPVCHRLSLEIVNYARRLALTRGGAAVVTASMVVEGEEVEQHPQLLQTYMGTTVDDGIILGGDFHHFPANFEIDDDEEEEEELESSKPPRGLSCGEINKLKTERFKNNGGNESVVCSVCLEEFANGVKITPLPCSHTFHNRCLASWLKKTASCPLCRFDITRADTMT